MHCVLTVLFRIKTAEYRLKTVLKQVTNRYQPVGSPHYLSSFQARTNSYIQGSTYVHAAPLATAQAVSQQQRVGPQETRPLHQKLIYIPKNPTANGNTEINLHQQARPTATHASNNRPKNQSYETRQKSDYIPSTTHVSSALIKKPYPRDQYPQQNFSFRRAVHRSLSSDSEKVKNNTKRLLITTPDLLQEGDKSSRKSDDRDSGTVVEPEASVFDFDSSVLSEDENNARMNNRSHPQQPPEAPAEDDDSRTCTPILPPLTTDDEFTDVVEEEQRTLSDKNLNYHQPQDHLKNQGTVFTRFVAQALIFFNLTHYQAFIQTGLY